MTPGARIAAAVEILDRIGAGTPAEKALIGWARASRFAGSKDRAAVRDHVYDALRRLRSAQWRGGGASGRQVMAGLLRLQGKAPEALFSGEGHAPAPLTDAEAGRSDPMQDAVRADLPDWLFAMFSDDLDDDLWAVIEQLQHRGPLFLRAARASQGRAAQALADAGITTRPVPNVSGALEVTRNPRRVQGSAPYRDGWVEIQDAGAQALCAALPLTAGDRVLDYCAGGGGKILALADRALIEGFAYDIAASRMADLPERARRAGHKITQLARPDAAAPYDLVLCDAPCSGSGTWRRTPDAKWRLTPQALDDLTQTQFDILAQAAPLVAPGGVLAYATCSVLTCENEAVAERFARAHPEWVRLQSLQWRPGPTGDGFFAALFRKS